MDDNLAWIDSLFGNAAKVVSAVKGNTLAQPQTAQPTGNGLPKWLLPAGIGLAVVIGLVMLLKK